MWGEGNGFLSGVMKTFWNRGGMAAQPGELPSFTTVNVMACARISFNTWGKGEGNHERWCPGLAPMGTRTEDHGEHLSQQMLSGCSRSRLGRHRVPGPC